jgi:hypothetical protein
MSRNGSGTYQLPAGNPVVTATTISSTWANTTLTDIATALTNSVAADGQTPITGALIGIGDTIQFGGTGQITLPVGTTAQRSATPAVGSVRFNTTLQTFEGYSTYSGQTISSITRVTTTATLTTAANHNLTTGTFVTVSGAVPAEYNGTFSITVVDATSFTYTMLATPSGSASTVGSYKVGYWGQIGGGATGNGGNQVFVLNDQIVTASYTIPTGKNASSAGPITIDTDVTVTVPTDSTWVIV